MNSLQGIIIYHKFSNHITYACQNSHQQK